MRFDLFCFGFVQYRLAQADAADVFEALHRAHISPKGIKRYEKTNEIRFFCTLWAVGRMRELQLPVTELRRGGVPVLANGLVHRPGLLCGILLAILLTIGARLFVWDVRVEGNEKIDTEELLSELSAVGLSRGTLVPSVDGERIALSLRQGDGRISYATVNLRGTVARVQIREAVVHESAEISPADLVAKSDGVIVLPLVFEGELLVQEGDVVRTGQLLASGVIESEKHGKRVTRAVGQILARTVHTYTVEVPFTYEEKVPTGKKGYDVDLLFFGFRGKVFKNSGNLTQECDIIQNIKWCTLPDGRELPFGIAVTESAAYEVKTVTRTAAKAREIAMSELTAQLAADSAGRTVLSRTVETVMSEDGVRLICTLCCEENIAVVREMEGI